MGYYNIIFFYQRSHLRTGERILVHPPIWQVQTQSITLYVFLSVWKTFHLNFYTPSSI